MTLSVSQNHGYFTASELNLCVHVCVCLWIKASVADNTAAQCHRQHIRNVPQHRDELWSLISRARSPCGLSAYVRHSPPQTHTRVAVDSSGQFPACGIYASHHVTPAATLALSKCLVGDLSNCSVTCLYCLCCSGSSVILLWQHHQKPSSHVCYSEEAQCGFKGCTSMSCLSPFTINPHELPSVFTPQFRKSSGKGNLKLSALYHAEQTLLTNLGISSAKWQKSQKNVSHIWNISMNLMSVDPVYKESETRVYLSWFLLQSSNQNQCFVDLTYVELSFFILAFNSSCFLELTWVSLIDYTFNVLLIIPVTGGFLIL